MKIQIDPIAVSNKEDVIKALNILERLGIFVMSEEKKATYLTDETKEVSNNFLIQDKDGFRIQSHYIGSGISLESLERQVNEIIEQSPNISNMIKELTEKENELLTEIEKKKIELKEIKIKEIKIKE